MVTLRVGLGSAKNWGKAGSNCKASFSRAHATMDIDCFGETGFSYLA
jgi:hypothetical protein